MSLCQVNLKAQALNLKVQEIFIISIFLSWTFVRERIRATISFSGIEIVLLGLFLFHRMLLGLKVFLQGKGIVEPFLQDTKTSHLQTSNSIRNTQQGTWVCIVLYVQTTLQNVLRQTAWLRFNVTSPPPRVLNLLTHFKGNVTDTEDKRSRWVGENSVAVKDRTGPNSLNLGNQTGLLPFLSSCEKTILSHSSSYL